MEVQLLQNWLTSTQTLSRGHNFNLDVQGADDDDLGGADEDPDLGCVERVQQDAGENEKDAHGRAAEDDVDETEQDAHDAVGTDVGADSLCTPAVSVHDAVSSAGDELDQCNKHFHA